MRFEALARRKEREALAAAIDPLATDVDCADDSVVAIGSAWSRALFDGPFYASPPRRAELPSTSLVFVQSRDGNTGAKNPSTLGGGEADTHLIYEGLSRVRFAADRKSTRLNSSHVASSYAAFCLKKKTPTAKARRRSLSGRG